MTELSKGFELARELLATHARVRLVGMGATLPREWPAWAKDQAGLSLCELGAYSGDSKANVTAPLRAAISEWLDATFAGVLPGSAGHLGFTGSAAMRVFQVYLDAFPVTQTLRVAHPDAEIRLADPTWVGAELLFGTTQRGGLEEVGWGLRFAATASFAFAGATVRTLRDRLQAVSSFRALGKDAGEAPKTWVALVADWQRVNWHVIETVALPTLARQGSVGIFLLLGLGKGQRAEATLRREGHALWAGLGPLNQQLPHCKVVQLVLPKSKRALGRTLASALVTSARVSRKLIARHTLQAGDLTLDLGAHVWSLAKLATLDVLRVRLVEAAARESLAAAQLAGSPVVFSANGTVEACTADLLLQAAGATTYHLFHGSSGDDFVGGAEHPSSFHCAWTAADAACQPAGRATLVAGMPSRARTRARRSQPRNILLMTGYAHRDNVGRYRFEPYQDELVAVLTTLRVLGHSELHLRWRPHPADRQAEVERTFASVQAHGIELSRGAPFADDTEWADLVVTNVSSVISECILADLPVFVHAQPDLWETPASTFVDPSRLFFYAADGAALIADYLGSEDAEARAWPERAARRALWGSSEAPSALLPHLGVH